MALIEPGNPQYEKYQQMFAAQQQASQASAASSTATTASAPMTPAQETPAGSEVTTPESANVQVSANNEEGQGVLDTLIDGSWETVRAIYGGAAKAVNSTLGLSASVSNYVGEVFDKGIQEAEFKEVPFAYELPEPDIQGAIPLIVQDITQFGLSFWGANKATPFLKAYSASGKVATWVTDSIRGGIADFVGQKADEANLTGTLIKEFPVLDHVLPDYMANTGDDTHIEGRLRNMLEGLALGVAVDDIMLGLKALKARSLAAKAKSDEELFKVLKENGLTNPDTTPEPSLKEARDKAVADGVISPDTQVDTSIPKAPKGSKKDPTQGLPEEQGVPEKKTSTLSTLPKEPQLFVKELRKLTDTGKFDYNLMSREDRDEIINRLAQSPEAIDELSADVNFNTYACKNDPEVKKFITAVANKHAENMALKRHTPETFEALGQRIAAVVDIFGTNVNLLCKGLQEATGTIEAAEAFRGQVAMVLPGKAREALTLAQKLVKDPANVTINDKRNFIKIFNDVQKLWVTDTNYKTVVARALNSTKYTGGPVRAGKADIKTQISIFDIFDEVPEDMDAKQFANWMSSQNITEEALNKAAHAVMASGGDPCAIFKNQKLMKSSSWGQYWSFMFTQNILTGPLTHMWTVLGNTTKLGSRAAERWLGTLASAPFSKTASEDIKETARYTAQLFHVWRTATQLAYGNLQGLEGLRKVSDKDYSAGSSSRFTESGVQSEVGSEEYLRRLFQKKGQDEDLAAWKECVVRGLAFASKPARMNAKLMGFEDDVFKNMEFQASMYAKINRKLDEAGITDAAEREAKYRQIVDNEWFTKEGLVNVKNADAQDALRMAEYTTYSQDVSTSAIEGIIEASRKSPFLKTVLPFIKTVWNVNMDVFEHFAGPTSKQWREDWKAGGARRQEAMGRLGFGLTTAYMFSELTDAGIITGALSDNPKEREAQLRAGKRPYSVRVGNSYYTYDRLDPFGMFMGIIANVSTIISNSDNMTEEVKNDLAATITGSILSTALDKSFLSNLKEFMDIFRGPRDTWGNKSGLWAARQVEGVLPASGLFRWAGNIMEDRGSAQTYIRPDSLLSWDTLKNTAYGRAFNQLAYKVQTLPVRYDWVTGKSPTHSYITSEAKGDWVLDELAYISPTTRGKTSKILSDGVKLTNEEYSQLCKLHGTVKIDGKNLYEALKDLMKSPIYDFDEKHHNHALIGDSESYKGRLVNRVIDKYRKLAKDTLLSQNSELRERYISEKSRRAKLKKGTLTTGRTGVNRTPLSELLGNQQ